MRKIKSLFCPSNLFYFFNPMAETSFHIKTETKTIKNIFSVIKLKLKLLFKVNSNTLNMVMMKQHTNSHISSTQKKKTLRSLYLFEPFPDFIILFYILTLSLSADLHTYWLQAGHICQTSAMKGKLQPTLRSLQEVTKDHKRKREGGKSKINFTVSQCHDKH